VLPDAEAFAIWITGLPASGKSTVAAVLAENIRQFGIRVAVLESDVLRKVFSQQPTYDEADRDYFYQALAWIGQTLTEHGCAVIFDATANRRAYRDRARKTIRRFIEVFLDCPLDVCIGRDPKGIYRSGREGQASHVPGLQSAYEPPEHPDIVIQGDQDDPEQATRRIVAVLAAKGFLKGGEP